MEATEDYGRFKFLPYNRATNPAHVKKLAESMRKYGFLIPVLTTHDGFVIDGQNRVKAAQLAKIPVKYIEIEVEQDSLPELVSTVNTTAKLWTLQNYLDLYCLRENAHYIRFQKFLKDNNLSVGDGLSILTANRPGRKEPGFPESRMTGSNAGFGGLMSVGTWAKQALTTGRLNFDDGIQDTAEQVAKCIMDIRNFSESYQEFRNTRRFIGAVVVFVTTRGYKHEKMMEKLATHQYRLYLMPSTKAYIEKLQEVYRKRAIEKAA